MKVGRRSLIIALAVAAAAALVVAGCASSQVRHAQKARAYLGDELFAQIVGDGDDTVVFLPGLMGSTAYWTSADRSSLSGKRLIFVDLLGFGRSPWPDVEYTLDDQIGALRRTLAKHGATRRLTLVAHSFGTIVAAHYAARHPEEVDRLILFGTPMYRSRADAAARVREMSLLAGLLMRSPIAARVVCTLHNAFMPLAARLAPRLRPEIPPLVAHDGALHFWPSLHGSVQHVIIGAPLPDALRLVGTRTTIVYGTHDVVSDRKYVQEIARKTGAQFVSTESDHTGYWRSWPDAILP